MSAPLAIVASMKSAGSWSAARWPACAGPPGHLAGSGRGWAACPSPACLGPARLPAYDGVRAAPFGHGRGLALVPGHDVDLIDLHLTLQPCCWGSGDEAAAQVLCHGLHVREVQAHEIEAQYPHPQRLMVPGQRRAGEVVEAPGAGLTPIALSMRLRVVAPIADYRVTATPGTAHAFRPAMLAHQREAFGVVQQLREVDQVG